MVYFFLSGSIGFSYPTKKALTWSPFFFSFFFKLENEKAEHAKEMRGLERQIAQLRDQLLKARHGLEDQARVSLNLF